MEHVLYFCLAFLISAFGRYWLYKRSKKPHKKERKNKKNKSNLAIEMKYLVGKFKLDREKIDTPKIVKYISILDGIIVAASATLALLVTDDMILIFILGIALIFVLIYVLYEILGRILIKKGYDKNGL